MTQIPVRPRPDQAAHHRPVHKLRVPARSTTRTPHPPTRHQRPTTQTMRRPSVLRLHGRRLRAILAPLRTKPLVLRPSLIGTPATGANPVTERHGRPEATIHRRCTLRTAASAVELIAMERAESLPTPTTGLHRDPSLSIQTHRREIFLCGGHVGCHHQKRWFRLGTRGRSVRTLASRLDVRCSQPTLARADDAGMTVHDRCAVEFEVSVCEGSEVSECVA